MALGTLGYSRYDDPKYQDQVSLQMLATPTHEIACRAIVDLRQRVKDLEQLYDTVTGPQGEEHRLRLEVERLEIELENARAGQTLARELNSIPWGTGN